MACSAARRTALCLALGLWLSAPLAVQAGTATFLEPSSYFSRCDSPFIDDLEFGAGVLEDFEDGVVDAPGVTVSAGAVVVKPGEGTDSVDADDGVIDGSGRGGSSLFASYFFVVDPFEPRPPGILFRFDKETLGALPTRAGVVWTDGRGRTEFEAFDADGQSLGVRTADLADDSSSGTTDEDRFFGVFYAGGISAIHVRDTGFGLLRGRIEIDHLQYVCPSPETKFIGPAGSFFGPTCDPDALRAPIFLLPVISLPYLSRSDSPFISFPFPPDSVPLVSDSMFLEDFEDGRLDAPGVTATAGNVLGPGSSTDSVDGDDGFLDGSGNAGYSFFSPNGPAGITFTFARNAVGGFPTQAVLVWTDGEGVTLFEAFDAEGCSLGIRDATLGDGVFGGGTGEDRFFGITHSEGVSAIRISKTQGGIEVDHLQFTCPFSCLPEAEFSEKDCNGDGFPDFCVDPQFECFVGGSGPGFGEPGYYTTTLTCRDVDTERVVDGVAALRYTFDFDFDFDDDTLDVRVEGENGQVTIRVPPLRGPVVESFTVEDSSGCYRFPWSTPDCESPRCNPTIVDVPPPPLRSRFGFINSTDVRTDDLAAAGAPTLASVDVINGGSAEGSSLGALNDGTVYAGGTIGETAGPAGFVPERSTQVVICLNTALSPSGYNDHVHCRPLRRRDESHARL